ncbi:glycine cleavage system protein H [Paenibacillus hexagrammi]|uniref:Glycine cleavage system protein H n=1 Tax=Paenibacillus hexagrammi TaxID=2908839 RepID=A0ABY3SK08_9BACL|nr:glycine cleavage system protein H [Paenibacillus sp. YPD9-1]UJF34387.1 glycine cleavage system protein H [Paenibacillus sp. YPD9-1]
MAVPLELKFTRDHYWIRLNGETAVIGFTEQGIANFGMILFVELPVPGTELQQGEYWGTAETAEDELDLWSPLTGKVIQTNLWLEKTTMPIYESPYDKGYLFSIACSRKDEFEGLLTAEEYEAAYPQ